jgi:hypothetical protein
MDLDSFLIALYVLVEDWWQEHHPSSARKKPGRPALLSESEVLTLAILAQWPRFRSQRDFWRFASAHLLPEPLHPESVQPQGASPGARVARCAAGLRRADRRAFGRLPGLGHDPGAGRGPGGGQRSWSATERRPSPGCWRALRPKSRHTPVDNGSTTPSVDRCATWQACWSSSLPISRLRIPDRGAAHPGTPRTGTAAALDAGAPAVLPRHPRGHHGPGRRPGQS